MKFIIYIFINIIFSIYSRYSGIFELDCIDKIIYDSDIIFSGKIIDIKKIDSFNYDLSIDIIKTYRGNISKDITIRVLYYEILLDHYNLKNDLNSYIEEISKNDCIFLINSKNIIENMKKELFFISPEDIIDFSYFCSLHNTFVIKSNLELITDYKSFEKYLIIKINYYKNKIIKFKEIDVNINDIENNNIIKKYLNGIGLFLNVEE